VELTLQKKGNQSYKKSRNLLHRYVPITDWLPRYQRAWLRTDLLAGLAVWALTVPQAMAYSSIAGVPPVYGLFSVPLAVVAYAIFGTSRTLSIGPGTGVAIISAATVGALAAQGSDDFLALTLAMALLVGVLYIIFGILRLGWVADFLANPVLKGFMQGLALVVLVGQMPKIFGVEGGSGNFFQELWVIIVQLPQANLVTTFIGLLSLAVLFAFKRFIPRVPGALITVFLAILLTTIFDLADYGVSVVGTVDTSLPPLGLPDVALGDLAGFSSGYVVVGSMSRTSLVFGSGGRTQVALLVNGGLVILTLLFLMPFFQNLPNATLGAIVIHAMIGLLEPSYFRRLYRISRPEFWYSMAAFLGELFLGTLPGVFLGVSLSVLGLIRQVTRPGTAIIGRMPDKETYRDVTLYPEAETVPGLLIFRFDSPLIFTNSTCFTKEIQQYIEAAETTVQEVLVNAETMNNMDTTGTDQLIKLREELEKDGIQLAFAKVKDPVREMMRLSGAEEAIGTENFYPSVSEGVRAFIARDYAAL
jgi:MFS superfamily sulfate permease-like transporter